MATLEYEPNRPHNAWLFALVRYAWLGPVTGAGIGALQSTAALLIWKSRGKPDFYFRGWSGVFLDFILLTVGGSVAGLGYGALLWWFEEQSRRRIRWISVPLLRLITFAGELAIVWCEFEREVLLFPFISQGVAMVLAVVVSFMTSVRNKNASTRRGR